MAGGIHVVKQIEIMPDGYNLPAYKYMCGVGGFESALSCVFVFVFAFCFVLAFILVFVIFFFSVLVLCLISFHTCGVGS